MSKKAVFILIGLLLLAIFVIAPLLLPSDDDYSNEEYASYEESDEDFDVDYKKSKSARSVGGSKSFKSGK